MSDKEMELTVRQRKLVKDNMGLVGHLIRKYRGIAGLEMGDLAGIGCYALCKAARRFDPKLGYKFCTYACQSIKHELINDADNQRDVIHIPRMTRYLAGKMARGENLGNFHMKEATAAKVRVRTRQFQPAHDRHGIGSYDPQGEEYSVPAPDEVPPLDSDDLSDLHVQLRRLTEVERDMITRRYFRGQTLKEIGEAHGRTRERVRQVINVALLTMRAGMEKRPELLAAFFEDRNRYKRAMRGLQSA